MSHFGFLCPPYAGHVNPMQALAGALIARGHSATFLGVAAMAKAVTERRCGFVPLGGADDPRNDLAALTRHMTHPRGLGLLAVIRDGAHLTDLICREAPEKIAMHGIDTIVADQLEPAGGLVAEACQLPFASVANALLINREDSVPPPFLGWRYDPSPNGMARNRAGYRVADILLTGPGRIIARHAERFGLASRRTMEACLSPTVQVSQTIAGFDFPRQFLPATMHHCGPLRSPEDGTDLDLRLDDLRPLVFASMGTLQGGRIGVFRHIAEVCRDLDLKLVIAHGGRLTRAECDSLPGRPVVRSFVPQRALLRRAILAVTNGGLNTVMDALAAGVPVVAIPIAFEQAAIASRLTYCGAGLAVPFRTLSSAVLKRAISRILQNSDFTARARTLAQEIGKAGGVETAASAIEAAVSNTHGMLASAEVAA